MKKFAEIIISLLLISLLCGCGDSGKQPDSPSPSETAQAEALTPEPEPVLWSQERMNGLPDPGGVLLALEDTEKGTRAVVAGMTPEETADYVEAVRELGYSTQMEGEDENGGLMFRGKNDGYSLTLDYSAADSVTGDSTCRITSEKLS